MYQVSRAYIEAIAQPVRDFKIAVTFKYADGTQAVFDDHDIVTGSDVIIESQAVSGSASCNTIDVGAVPTATASLAILEDDTNLHRYAGAEFNIRVSLKLESGEYEDVQMGTFYVDISKTSRIGNKIEVFGYDAMPSLMYDISGLKAELKGMTASSAVKKMVNVSRVKCKFIQGISKLPNSALPLDFSSVQIETARDAIMWIAQLMGCFARINRSNYLEFVPIKSNWVWYNDDHTSGTIGAARLILGAQRYETKFSDDRIHICGLSMLGKDGYLDTFKREGLESDSNVIINLEQNPLIIASETSTSTILNAILDQLSTTYFYAFRSEIINDPALDAGDTIRLEGGVINGTNHNEDLIGFITHNTWRYRGGQTVVNTGHISIGYEGTESLPSNGIVPASPQSEKAVQANVERNSIPPDWVGIVGGKGIRVENYTPGYISGGVNHIAPGVKISVQDKFDKATSYGVMELGNNAFEVRSSHQTSNAVDYILELGGPVVRVRAPLFNVGLEISNGGVCSVYMGKQNKLTLELDKDEQALHLRGVKRLYIEDTKVFDIENEG